MVGATFCFKIVLVALAALELVFCIEMQPGPSFNLSPLSQETSSTVRVTAQVQEPPPVQSSIVKLKGAADLGPQSFTLLQYNTHLFEGGYAAKDRWIVELATSELRRLEFYDSQRRSMIVQKIRQQGADVVALNEVWSDEKRGWFVNELRDMYPFSALGPYHATLDPDCLLPLESSGVILLSKFEILGSLTYSYKRPGSCKSEENRANKGVLVAVLRISSRELVLSLSHTAGPRDIEQLAQETEAMASQLVGPTYTHRWPLVIAGDLNVHQREPDSKNFDQIMSNHSFSDTWIELGHDPKAGATVDLPNNELDRIFSPTKPPNPSDVMQVDRLDRVLYRSSGYSPIRPLAADVIKNWKFPITDYYYDVLRLPWQSNYVAIRSFVLDGQAYLFGLKKTNEAYITKIRDEGRGWYDVGHGGWSSDYVASAVRTFTLNGRPYVFALKNNGVAYISRIKDKGLGWDDVFSGKWQSNYVAVVPFYLQGHPYLFGLKQNNRGYISRINDNGKGWQDLGSWSWSSNYVANAITSFELNGHAYLFALKNNDVAYISRINDDGRGWTDVFSGKWQSNYGAVVSYKLDGHPYLFGLKNTGEAFISRINDDGHGWTDVQKSSWDANYVKTCIDPFYIHDKPYLFSLKQNNEGWITRLIKPGYLFDLSDHYPLLVKFALNNPLL